jgi:hypothetical protein
VWRSMHLGGRLRVDTAHRVWPGWTEEKNAPSGDVSSQMGPVDARTAKL